MKIKVKSFTTSARLPKKGTNDRVRPDLGADLTVTKRTWLGLFKIKYDFDIAVQAEHPNVGFWIAPRSSVHKTNQIMANSIGLIDPNYTGPISAVFWVLPWAYLPRIKNWKLSWFSGYKVGDKACQLIPTNGEAYTDYYFNSEFELTERGLGGYGSTGI